MKKNQIAVQLYSFRNYIQTPEDAVNTLRRIKEIGYDTIELSPALEMPAKDALDMVLSQGLGICGCGFKAKELIESPDSVIKYLQELGCTRAVYGFPHMIPHDEKEMAQFISELKIGNQRLADVGITMNYHNHAVEFVRFGGKCWLDIIYSEIPELFAELDTFWIQEGGANPVDWIRRMAGRMTAIHLKDYGVVDNNGRKMMSVGQGNLNWDMIIPAAVDSGADYFVVEHDGDCEDPFESFATSMNYLQKNFIN